MLAACGDDRAPVAHRFGFCLTAQPVGGRARDFWPASWGPRPNVDDVELEVLARGHLSRWHLLVPVFAHRYLPAAPAPLGSPVFSVMQTDVVHYGSDLVDYVRHELHLP